MNWITLFKNEYSLCMKIYWVLSVLGLVKYDNDSYFAIFFSGLCVHRKFLKNPQILEGAGKSVSQFWKVAEPLYMKLKLTSCEKIS